MTSLKTPMDERWSELEKFVGRTSELDEFEKVLHHPRGQKRTLLIQGVGGQGKTWLIKKMLLEAAENSGTLVLKPNRLVDMYSTTNRHLEGVLAALEERVVEELGTADPFQPYYEARKELENARQQEEYSGEDISHKVEELGYEIFRNCLQAITEEKVIILAFDTFENVNDTDVSEWILSDSGLQMPNLICLVGTRIPLTDEQRVDYPSVQEITLGGLSDDDAIQLYLSYTGESETTVNASRKDFIRVLNEKSVRNPLMLGLAIIYLDLPGEDDKAEAVRQLTPAEFEREVVAWFSPATGPGSIFIRGSEYSEEMRQALILLSYLNRRFNRYFLQMVLDAGYIQCGDATADELWSALNLKKPELFYVKERPEGEIQLHDKLAELLRKHVLISAFNDRTGENLRQFVNSVVKWYEEPVTLAATPESLNAEQLAYLLRSDLYADCQSQPSIEICARLAPLAPQSLAPQPDEIVAVLEAHFRRRSDVLARLLIKEAKLPLIEQFGGRERYRIYMLLGQIAEQCYKHEAAQAYLQKAYEIAVGEQNCDRQAEALISLHNSTFPVDPEKSLEILEKAEVVCEEKVAEKRLPKVLYEKGFIHTQLNKLPEANSWYEKARSHAKRLEDEVQMPIILNDWGYNFLLIGDLARGRALIRTGRDLRYKRYTDLTRKQNAKLRREEREKLTEDLKDAQKMLGLSYSTLGDLARFSDRLDEAVTRYTEALDLFKKCGSHYWQTRMYFTRGEAYRRIATEDYDAGRKAKFKKSDRQADEDITKSLDLCRQYGFRKDSATAYRRLGRLYHDRMFRTASAEPQFDLLGKARDLFKKALLIARDVNDPIEIFENLTELAFLADDYLDLVKAHKPAEFTEAREAANSDIQVLRQELEEYARNKENPIHFFPVFQHLLELEEAAYFFALEEYERALPLYIRGYKGLAQSRGYGVARYLQHRDHLTNQLRELSSRDRELAEQWSNEILAAWDKAGLMEKRPELPQEIEMLMSTLFLYKDSTP